MILYVAWRAKASVRVTSLRLAHKLVVTSKFRLAGS